MTLWLCFVLGLIALIAWITHVPKSRFEMPRVVPRRVARKIVR